MRITIVSKPSKVVSTSKIFDFNRTCCRQRGAGRSDSVRDGVPLQLAAGGASAAALQPHAAGRPTARLPRRGALQVAHPRATGPERQVR